MRRLWMVGLTPILRRVLRGVLVGRRVDRDRHPPVDTGDVVLTTWTWCPPQTFVRDLIEAEGDSGELEAFRRSWCTYDWQFNDLLAGGRGAYEREHTLSPGAGSRSLTPS